MIRSFSLFIGAALCCACSRPPTTALPPPAAETPEPEQRSNGPRTALPAELMPFRAQIDRSEQTYVAIAANKQSGTSPWQSKFLGAPYMPQGQPYPHGADGKPLILLAQINFAEMPNLPDYPTSGIVQFFTSQEESSEHIYGALQATPDPVGARSAFNHMLDQRYFRVIYHANVVADATKLSTPDASSRHDPGLPIMDEAALRFETRREAVTVQDYRFGQFLGKPAGEFFAQFMAKESAVATAYISYAGNWPLAKIGGYTNLVQHDPRLHTPNEDWLILLEIRSAGSDDDVDIAWGDNGVGVFFIRRADLQRRDFSKVAYHWDNH